jgi:hypothetical protein
MPPGPYTSAEFQAVRTALLRCQPHDLAFLRRWIVRWVDDRGHICSGAEPLPDRGIGDECSQPRRAKQQNDREP